MYPSNTIRFNTLSGFDHVSQIYISFICHMSSYHLIYDMFPFPITGLCLVFMLFFSHVICPSSTSVIRQTSIMSVRSLHRIRCFHCVWQCWVYRRIPSSVTIIWWFLAVYVSSLVVWRSMRYVSIISSRFCVNLSFSILGFASRITNVRQASITEARFLYCIPNFHNRV